MAGSTPCVDAILILSPEEEAALRHTPRGNLSDLYPRWLGARELLLHGRDPYGVPVTYEIQVGYYGEALDGMGPSLPKDQQGFAYPLYVVFLLAPTVKIPFFVLRVSFRLLLIVLTVATVSLWIQVLGLRIGRGTAGIVVVLLLGSFSVLQGLYLDQLTLLVCFLVAGCAAVARGKLMQAGILLVLSTIRITAFVFGWQWNSALALTAASLFGPAYATQHVPHLPLLALLGLPFTVFFLLRCTRQTSGAAGHISRNLAKKHAELWGRQPSARPGCEQ
jgi:hypothetical protein